MKIFRYTIVIAISAMKLDLTERSYHPVELPHILFFVNQALKSNLKISNLWHINCKKYWRSYNNKPS